MESISKSLKVNVAKDKAFSIFLNELNEWWPKEYTWSQDKLMEIRIDGQIGGLCTEIGPHGFRVDWGRVTDLTNNEKIILKWQISPNREPIPDPKKSSDIEIYFKDTKGLTEVELQHKNFENHADDAEDYRNLMNGEFGWSIILKAYKDYCEN